MAETEREAPRASITAPAPTSPPAQARMAPPAAVQPPPVMPTPAPSASPAAAVPTAPDAGTPPTETAPGVERSDGHAHARVAIRPNGHGPHPMPGADDGAMERGATAPQLRRFIKSRAYVPMHELRRRFAINSADDDVTPVDLERRRVFVGLPEREGRLLGELLRGGDIGFELSLDPITPIVVGVYPMRPVTRA